MAEKILIIDDDVQTLRLVGLMLERQGYKIITSVNATQGLRAARSEQPDVILLDVMMPDMDGYEVARRLRKMPETAHLPILMFTARSQVEDKVAGYESGVDDYLTKPIHPAELIAHIKSLLSRQKARAGTTTAPREKGYVVGVIAPKGGLGVSTLALNLAIAFHQKTKREVIAAEMRQGQGTWATELAFNGPDGLGTLLRQNAMDINTQVIEKELVRVPYGIRLLYASSCSRDSELLKCTDQVEAVIDCLPMLARLVILDIGTPYVPFIESALNRCNEVIVVTEPFPSTVFRTRQLIEELMQRGIGRSKYLTVVSVNRVRADIQMSVLQMQEILKMNVSQVIPPAPEIAYQAAMRNVPVIQVQMTGIFGQQFLNLAQQVADRVSD